MVFYLDSQAASKALIGRHVSSRLVALCSDQLCWVSWHAGVRTNKIADELTRAAAAWSVEEVDVPVKPLLGFFVFVYRLLWLRPDR